MPRPTEETSTSKFILQNASSMKDPQLTSVSLALPERIQALSHVVNQINDLLKPETIDSAVYNDCQYVIRTHGFSRKWTKKAMDEAAARGRLDIVKWLYVVRNDGCTIAAMDEAVANGHLDVVKWLRAHYFRRCSSGALNTAAKAGHSDVVKWLCRINRLGDEDAHAEPYLITDGVQVVAAREDIDTLRVLVKENCTVYHLHRALQVAAANGQIAVAKVLLSVELQQASVTNALKNAVSRNHMEMVKLLADRCSSADIRAAYSATTLKGNPKISKLLRETIKARLVEEKWGYYTTQRNILEHRKTAPVVATNNDKAVWYCGMLGTW